MELASGSAPAKSRSSSRSSYWLFCPFFSSSPLPTPCCRKVWIPLLPHPSSAIHPPSLSFSSHPSSSPHRWFLFFFLKWLFDQKVINSSLDSFSKEIAKGSFGRKEQVTVIGIICPECNHVTLWQNSPKIWWASPSRKNRQTHTWQRVASVLGVCCIIILSHYFEKVLRYVNRGERVDIV